MMQRYAFKMFLNPGQRDEYKKRHDTIWPELSSLLHHAGVRNYSIFLDEETNVLFAYLERPENHTMDSLPQDPVMRRWWDYMKDLMSTDATGAPIAKPIGEVFHLD
jgi:L-rhamnose mutarotase